MVSCSYPLPEVLEQGGFHPAADSWWFVQGLEGNGCKHNPQDVFAGGKGPHEPPELQIFQTVGRDEGGRRGEAARACVYVFRQHSLIQDHKGLLDHPLQPDLLYNTVHGVSLLVLY